MLKLPPSVFACQKATLAARARTGQKSIGTQVNEHGRIRVVHTTYNAKGSSTITPLTDWSTSDEAIAFLNQMK